MSKMDFTNHPCFNPDVRHSTGRIHLPVAAKCNVQCNFCNRKFDCANENRPGVSTAVLKPDQALAYLRDILKQVPNIAVVGIAGPGDPFANPKETMNTLELIHAHYPDKLLCLSSNGLQLKEYIPRIAQLNVSHVTITVNAVDPKIGAEIYEWFYYDKKVYYGIEGATFLLERQTEAIKLLKQYGITVKINTVVVPRVNEYHVQEIAEYVSKLGADIHNCIPLIPVEGTPFGELYEPTPSDMRTVRAKSSVFIKQMSHCTRCRADAVGLLGEKNSSYAECSLAKAKELPSFIEKPYIAVSSLDGVYVNQHLGEVPYLWIYGFKKGDVTLIEKRSLPANDDAQRWEKIAETLFDCGALLVNGIGRMPLELLSKKGLYIEAVDGVINDAADALFNGKYLPKSSLKMIGQCGSGNSCSGSGIGCI